MALFDLPLGELETYLPERTEPEDFTEFWTETLTETRAHPLSAQFIPVDAGLKTLETFDVSFAGFGGQTVKGWLLLPKGETNLPCVVETIGYGGGRGFPTDWLAYSSAGYAHLVMDTRGQGSVWRQGDTPDEGGSLEAGGPSIPGFMTRGILDPHTYYYRRLITDAVRAVETAAVVRAGRRVTVGPFRRQSRGRLDARRRRTFRSGPSPRGAARAPRRALFMCLPPRRQPDRRAALR